jgi:tetratricopeptide (TPR) repeat protein
MPEVHNLLALVYFAQKKFDKAALELEWEVRINPSYTLAHVNLGRIYWYEFRNKEKALTHLRAALLLDPFLPNRMEIQRLVRQLEGLP